jgi:uncharacterized membrane protein YfcA
MQIYLPIAEMSVNVWLVLSMGAAVGFVTGMFGVGGGFLMTPFLIFYGVTPSVAVATGASQIVASSVSGIVAQRGRAVDFKMGLVLVAGGMPGSFIGVWLLSLLRGAGQSELVIKVSYVLLLGIVGLLMLSESINTWLKSRQPRSRKPVRASQHIWLHGLPFKLRFRVSKLYISSIPPLLLGFFSGVLSGIMGIGGGFIMVPAMIYILRMPAAVVVGTSLFQVLCVTIVTTLLQAWINHTVDIVLGLLLMLGGVVGVQYGARVGQRLRSDQLRFLIALLIVGMAARLALELIMPPGDLFSIAPVKEA